MNRSLLKKIGGAFAILLVFVFSVLMLNTIRQYDTFQTNVGFLNFKQQVVNNKFWLWFFYVHIFSIVLCLLVGMTQFSQLFLSKFRRLHRVIGKIYVYNIVVINFPACMVLALFSNGGLLGILGFVLQDFLWIFFTVVAVYHIKKGNVNKHKNFMILSYAITTTAITFRIIKNLIYDDKIFDYELFYGLNVWISMILNLLIAGFFIYNLSKKLPFESKSTDKNEE